MPWIIIPSSRITDAFRLPKNTFFDLLSFTILCFFFNEGAKFYYRNKYLFWFVSFVMFSILVTWYIPFTFVIDGNQMIPYFTLEPTFHFIFTVILSFIALCYFTSNDYEKIAKAICCSAVMVSCFGIMQVIGFDPMSKIFKYETLVFHPKFTAFLDHSTMAGSYLSLCLPYFFMFFKKNKYKVGLIICIIGIVLSRSTMSYVCLGVSFFLWGVLNYRKNKKILIALIIIFVLSVSFIIKGLNPVKIGNELNGRTTVWKDLVPHIKDNPLFGQGLGITKTFNLTYGAGKERLTTAHCDWFEIVLQLGFIGLCLFILVIINTLRRFDYKITNKLGFSYFCSFVSFFVLMCGLFPMEFAPTGLLGLISFYGTEKL